MNKKTVSDYEFYWDNLDLCVSPSLDNIDPALALPLSVEKWDVARKADCQRLVDIGGRTTCGLCAVFWNMSIACEGCIIKEVTGQPFCRDTPYCYYAETSEQIGRLFEAEYQFLLALQSGGVKAGREWLAEWNASHSHDVITEALAS